MGNAVKPLREERWWGEGSFGEREALSSWEPCSDTGR